MFSKRSKSKTTFTTLLFIAKSITEIPTTASQTAPQHAKQEYQDTLREFEKKVDKLKTENIKFADERIQNINPGNIDANLTGKSQRQDCSHHAFRSQYGQDEFFICVHD